jgi:hypothetical protein
MNQIAILESLMEVLKNEIALSQAQAKDLHCCGNCKKYVENRNCYNMRPGSYCPGWLPDGLKREDRE